MKRVTKYFFSLFFLFSMLQTRATHIVGGEIYYDYLGNNKYKITLKVYRDCFNGIPPLDNPALLRVYDAAGAIVDTFEVSMLSISNVPPSINNPCITPPGTECVEEGIYVDTLILPPRAGGYYVVYQRCCRNNSILNIVNPGNTGTTYWEHIPGPEIVAVNSSPRFNKFPPIFTCNGIQIKFDHAATDPDGDQLVYSLCAPFDGCSPPLASGGCPIAPPPYTNITFQSPYSGSFPMSSSPVININSSTGFLNGTPDINGQWVVGVCVQEFRGSQLIGTHFRDFQFNVVTCQISVLAQFNDQSMPITPLPNQFCTGLTINFKNSSIGGTNFTWNFGDTTTLGDTSHLVNPSYTYPDTGKYTVTLIANPGKPCADTTSAVYYVYPELKPTFVAPPPQCITNNSFNFNVGGQFSSYTTFNWNFGTSASIITSTLQSPSGIVYNAPGTFPVTVLATQKMCKKTLLDTVEVYAVPTSSFTTDSIDGCDPVTVTFTNSSTSMGTPTYFWQFGDGGTSTLKNPTHVFTPAGVYGVTLSVISTVGCIDTAVYIVPGMVTVNIHPQAGFGYLPTGTSIFDPIIYFYDSSSYATSYYYTFGDGGSSTMAYPSHEYGAPGSYTVVQTVVNGFGCPDTAVKVVTISPEFRFWVPNSFTPGNKDGLNDVFLPVVIGAEEYVFEIYDRWGERIFRSKDTQKGWDGTRGGKPCPQDVYVWMITLYNTESLREEWHYGHVTLLK